MQNPSLVRKFWLSVGLASFSITGSPWLMMANLLGTTATTIVFTAPAQAAILSGWEFDPTEQELEIVVPGGTTPRYFLVAEPARIVLELPGTDIGTVPTQQTYGGAIREIRIAQFEPGITRIVMELAPGTVLAPGHAELRQVGEGTPEGQQGDRWVLRPLLVTDASTPMASTPPTPDASVSPTTPSTTPQPPSPPQNLPESSVPAPNSPAPQPTADHHSATLPDTTPPSQPFPSPSMTPSSPDSDESGFDDLPPLEPGAMEIPVELPPDMQTASSPAETATETVTAPDLPTEDTEGAIDSERSHDSEEMAQLEDTPEDTTEEIGSASEEHAEDQEETRDRADAEDPDEEDDRLQANADEAGNEDVDDNEAENTSDDTSDQIADPSEQMDSEADSEEVVAEPEAEEPSEETEAAEMIPSETSTLPPPSFPPASNQPTVPSALPPADLLTPPTVPSTPDAAVNRSTDSTDSTNPANSPNSIEPSVQAVSPDAIAPTPSPTPSITTPPTESTREPIEFGQPLPESAFNHLPSGAPGAVSPNPNTANILLPSGTVLNLRYVGEEPLELAEGSSRQEVLVLAESVEDDAGNIILPEGSHVIGRFETKENGSQFVTQAISLQGQNILLRAQSDPLTDNSEFPGNDLLRNSALGVAAGVVLGSLTGIGLIPAIAAGAATSAATTYITPSGAAVIRPNQVVEVRLIEDLAWMN